MIEIVLALLLRLEGHGLCPGNRPVRPHGGTRCWPVGGAARAAEARGERRAMDAVVWTPAASWMALEGRSGPFSGTLGPPRAPTGVEPGDPDL